MRIVSVLFIFDPALQHNEKKKQRQHFFHSFFNGFALTELQKIGKPVVKPAETLIGSSAM